MKKAFAGNQEDERINIEEISDDDDDDNNQGEEEEDDVEINEIVVEEDVEDEGEDEIDEEEDVSGGVSADNPITLDDETTQDGYNSNF